MAQVKKLSIATVCGAVDLKAVLNSDKPIHMMRAYGMAVGTKTGQSAYGDWTALVGQFKAINIVDGVVSEAAQLFLPDVALVPIQVALANNGGQGTSFAVDVFAARSANKKAGGSPYEYSFSHVLPPAEDDPVARIEAAMAEAQLLLSGPGAGDDKGDDKGDNKGTAPAGGKGKKK